MATRSDVGGGFRLEPRLRATLLLLGGFWTFWWAALTFYWWVAGEGETGPDALRRIPVMALGAGLCLALAGVLRLLRRRSFVVRALAAALLLLPISVVYAGASVAVFQGPEALLVSDGHTATEIARSLVLKVIRWMPSLICCAAMVLALDYAFDIKEREARIAELAGVANLAHLAALRFQVNPHFLFNALNSAVSLVVTKRADEAEHLLRNLAAFLRSTLAHAPLDEIPLEEELTLQAAYLHVEKVRFPDRLRFSTEISRDAAQAAVPSLLLQPLLENAVKHGVGRSSQLTSISIHGLVERDQLVLTVVNDVSATGAAGEGLGVGLANVRARLQAAYGEDASFEAGPQACGGYRVRIALPFRRAAGPPAGARAAQAPGRSPRRALPSGTPRSSATAER